MALKFGTNEPHVPQCGQGGIAAGCPLTVDRTADLPRCGALLHTVIVSSTDGLLLRAIYGEGWRCPWCGASGRSAMTRKAFSLLVVCSAAVCLPGAVSAADAMIAPIGRHVERVALPAVSGGFGSNTAGTTIVGQPAVLTSANASARAYQGGDTATPSKQAPHSAGHACHPGS